MMRIMEEQGRRERLLGSVRGVLDNPVIRLAEEIANSPAARMAREFAESPTAKMLQDLADSPSIRMMQDLTDDPAVQAIRETSESPALKTMREIAESQLKALGTVRADLPTIVERPTPPMPLVHLSPDYQAQLIDEVVELRGDVAELQQEVRDVRESAARDAHRGRRQIITRDQKESRIRVWHLVVSCILSSALTALFTWALTKWLGG
jgi:hypothetical protein